MAQAVETKTTKGKSEPDVRLIPIADIAALGNIRETNDDELRKSGLVDSIKEQGILEPILVRPLPPAGANLDAKVQAPYELVFGFRRHRAAALAGLRGIPAEVREMSDAEVLDAQLAENLARKDLTPIDEAKAYKRALEIEKGTQVELAKRIGRSQPHVANRLRLLQLPEDVQGSIRAGIVTPHQAEVLLKIPKEAAAVLKEAQRLAAQNVPAPQLDREVKWRLDRWSEDEKERKMLESAPSCPTCKGKAIDTSMYNLANVVCSKNHEWNPKTGKAVDRAGINLGGREPRPQPRAKPKVEKEPGTIRSFHEPYAIARKLLEDLDAKEVERLSFNQRRLEVVFRAHSLNTADFYATAHAYSTGERTEIALLAWDDRRRKGMRESFQKWEKKRLPKVAAPKGKKAKAVDPKLLEGSVDKVLARIPKKDVEALELVRVLEVKGKKRAGVLRAIDALLRENAEGTRFM